MNQPLDSLHVHSLGAVRPSEIVLAPGTGQDHTVLSQTQLFLKIPQKKPDFMKIALIVPKGRIYK